MLKQIHAEMGGIENVEKLMGESEDARAYQRQISEMLGGQMSNQDEDEVEDELEALAKEVGGGVNLKEEAAVDYPIAPQREPQPAQVPDRSSSQRKERAKARAREAGSAQVSEPMLA